MLRNGNAVELNLQLLLGWNHIIKVSTWSHLRPFALGVHQANESTPFAMVLVYQVGSKVVDVKSSK